MVHIENLYTLLKREALHAPNHIPLDGLPYVGIHANEIQATRGKKEVGCGPGGIILDYVGFYFGPLSPMLYRIHTGHNVEKVDQSCILYLVSSAQVVKDDGLRFVFYDGHSLAAYSKAFENLKSLGEVDWDVVNLQFWNDTPNDMDRQRRKQAEFLVYLEMPWHLIQRIGVLNNAAKEKVEAILKNNPSVHQPAVSVERIWYY